MENLKTVETLTITTDSEANYGNNPSPQVTVSLYWWSDSDIELVTEDSGPQEMSEIVAPGATINYEDSYSAGGSPVNTSSTLMWTEEDSETFFNNMYFLESIVYSWKWDYTLESSTTTTFLSESTSYELLRVE